MKSKIYVGSIEHHRYRPITHDLAYPVYMFAFDLAELPGLNRRYPLFGYNRRAVTAIHDRDYLEPGNTPIKDKIQTLLNKHEVESPVSRIIMITSPRYFNYVFNPVSFYYCFDTAQELAAIIAEVNNTYGERHPYVLTKNTSDSARWFAVFDTPKQFHVSPFNRVEGVYRFYFSEPGDRLEIRIELHNDTNRENNKIMAAILKADGMPLTCAGHLKAIFRYPFVPHLSIPRIYTHAFKLFFHKKLTFNDKPIPQNPMTLKKQTPGFVESICKKVVFMALKRISIGCLEMKMPNQEMVRFGNLCSKGSESEETAMIRVHDFRFFKRVVFDGEIGFGEAYMNGEWDSPDLVNLSRLLIKNRDHFSDGNLLLSYLTRLKEKTAHDKRLNSIKNTPENIRAHYDLSNVFYALFLDRQMLYSCGIYKNGDDTLEAAQEQKMQRIIDQADIRDCHHILEIGCGWGGFAVFAAKQTGCRVTGITVSRAQYDRARQRVNDEGLGDRITILLQDYRHTQGRFDRVVSIEMIEAVGPQFFPTYFKQAQARLKPGGKDGLPGHYYR